MAPPKRIASASNLTAPGATSEDFLKGATPPPVAAATAEPPMLATDDEQTPQVEAPPVPIPQPPKPPAPQTPDPFVLLWERKSNGYRQTARAMDVEGGCIFKSAWQTPQGDVTEAMCYVPNVKAEQFKAHTVPAI